MVVKEFRHHEVSNAIGENHGVILVDEVDAFEISIGECYGKKTSRQLYINTIDINTSDGIGMML